MPTLSRAVRAALLAQALASLAAVWEIRLSEHLSNRLEPLDALLSRVNLKSSI